MASTATELFEEMYEDMCAGYARCVDDPESPLQERTTEAVVGMTYILEGVNANVPDFRKINEQWAIANVLHFFACTEEGGVLCQYNRNADRFLTDGRWIGAYGAIAMPQIGRCIDLLRKHPSTRRAVVSMGGLEHNDINRPSCWSFLHFLEQDEELHMLVYQRSLNLTRIMPYDCVLLTNVLNYVAAVTDSTVGSLTWMIGSLHVVEDESPPLNGAVVQRDTILLPPLFLAEPRECLNALVYPSNYPTIWET